MDCKECHERFRADKIIEDYAEEKGITLQSSVDGWTQEEMKNFIEENQVPCRAVASTILQTSASST